MSLNYFTKSITIIENCFEYFYINMFNYNFQYSEYRTNFLGIKNIQWHYFYIFRKFPKSMWMVQVLFSINLQFDYFSHGHYLFILMLVDYIDIHISGLSYNELTLHVSLTGSVWVTHSNFMVTCWQLCVNWWLSHHLMKTMYCMYYILGFSIY